MEQALRVITRIFGDDYTDCNFLRRAKCASFVKVDFLILLRYNKGIMKSYSIIQNVTFLTVASVLQKIISFSYFTLIARLIGVSNIGNYFFAIAFTTIFTVIADFGLGPVLTRETAKYPTDTETNVNTVFLAKLLFGAVVYGLLFISANLLNYSPNLKALIYLSGLTMIFDNLHGVFYSTLRARKNLFFESIGVIGSQFITLVIGTTALLLHWPLWWLIVAYIVPSALNVIYSGSFVVWMYKIKINFSFNYSLFKKLMSFAIPFALAGVIGRLYSYTDSIIMSKWLDARQLGWWSVPYKLTFAFQFIPAALSAGIYPVMSLVEGEANQRLAKIFERAWQYLFIIVFPLALGIWSVAKIVVVTLYGASYLPSVIILQILMLSMIFGYLSYVSGALLNATGRQSSQTWLLFAAWLVSSVLNIIFIPRYGIISAAVCSVVGSLIMFVGGYYLSNKVITISHKSIFWSAVRALIPSIFMVIVVKTLALWLNIFIVVPIGAVVYLGVSLITKNLMLKDLKQHLFKLKTNPASPPPVGLE